MSEIGYRVTSLSDAEIIRRLTEMEERFAMTSAQFLPRYNAGELGDDAEFVEWSGLLCIAQRVGVYTPAST